MSTVAVRTIVALAASDADFRSLLMSRPEQALAGYDLTLTEVIGLAQLHVERFDAVASDLDVRESRAISSINNFSSQLNSATSIVKS